MISTHTRAGNVVKREKKGMLSCCKCLFEKIETNLAHIQPENLQNVRKMRFWQKALAKSFGSRGLDVL